MFATDLIRREVSIVNAPLREIGTDDFIGMLSESFVIFQQRRIQRQQMASVGIRHDNQFACAFGTAAVVTQFDLFLIAAPF